MLRFLLSVIPVAMLLLACAPTALTPSPLGAANGRLDAADQTLESGEYYETYSYAARAGEILTISLSSSEIDPYLILLDPDGETIAEVDDSSGYGLDVQVSVGLPVTGAYTIVVTSAFPGETGSFVMDLRSGSRVTPQPESPWTPTEPSDSAWSPAGAA